jgi:hypothetical protein
MDKAFEMWLFTNRNCMIFNEKGEQIPEYQIAVSCYNLEPVLAFQATEEATKFYISKFKEWSHEIRKEEMQYLLGVHK